MMMKIRLCYIRTLWCLRSYQMLTFYCVLIYGGQSQYNSTVLKAKLKLVSV